MTHSSTGRLGQRLRDFHVLWVFARGSLSLGHSAGD